MFETTETTRAGRMMAAGRVTVTFKSPSGQHITISAKARKKDGERWVGCPLDEAMVVFFEIPNSGGWGDKVGKATRARGFVADPRADEARTFCARMLLRYVAGQPLPEGLEAREESRCGKCGRALTDPVSIDRGIGPECYGALTGSEHQTKVRVQGGRGNQHEAAGNASPSQSKTAGNTTPAARGSISDQEKAALALAANAAAMGDAAATGRALRLAEQLERESKATPVESLDAAIERSGSGDFGHALRSRTKVSDGKDKQGVAYGHGDWRARQKVAREQIQGDKAKDSDAEHKARIEEIERLAAAGDPRYNIPY